MVHLHVLCAVLTLTHIIRIWKDHTLVNCPFNTRFCFDSVCIQIKYTFVRMKIILLCQYIINKATYTRENFMLAILIKITNRRRKQQSWLFYFMNYSWEFNFQWWIINCSVNVWLNLLVSDNHYKHNLFS
jgi:hypothetical protein